MTTQTHLIHSRRFLPLFATQLLNAFNDNLFKNAMVLFVVYSVYQSEQAEAQFSAIASAVFILPFFVLSAISGQLADMADKARIIRAVKIAEIGIMLVGATGLLMASRGIMVSGIAIPLILLYELGIVLAGFIKARSRGFRNRANFRNAIYFHLGGLDLYPNAIYEAPSD